MEEDNRKLAHIEIIESLSPIEGADKIEKVGILGWSCVVKKGEFNINDKCIYIEIDSIVKECPEFEFLRKYKFRVKTQKIRGIVSQGLAIPLKTFNILENIPIGTDVTDDLGITKYLTPSEQFEQSQYERNLASSKKWYNRYKWLRRLHKYGWFRKAFFPKKAKKDWPSHVSKTNEERLQNIPHVLQQFADKEVYVTEKIDFQSVTFTGKLIPKFKLFKLHNLFSKLRVNLKSKNKTIYHTIKYIHLRWLTKYQFVVCSRNLTTNDKSSLYWKIAEKYNLEKILKENPTLTIQGEQGDTKVQGNKYGIKEPTMWVFNIIDHERNYHYDYEEMYNFCLEYGLDIVPLLQQEPRKATCKLSKLGSTVQELVEFSKGKSVINPKIEREGVVVRCIENGQKLLSFKIINPNFLLKYSD